MIKQPPNANWSPVQAVINLIPFQNILHKIVNGDRSGKGQFLIAVVTTANTPQDFPISLGHTPQIYLDCGQLQAGNVFASATDQTHWSGSNIRLQASVAGTYLRWVV